MYYIKNLCDVLGIDSEGTIKELAIRLEDYINQTKLDNASLTERVAGLEQEVKNLRESE